jgi:hypothetical protein
MDDNRVYCLLNRQRNRNVWVGDLPQWNSKFGFSAQKKEPTIKVNELLVKQPWLPQRPCPSVTAVAADKLLLCCWCCAFSRGHCKLHLADWVKLVGSQHLMLQEHREMGPF